jgi:predicted O-linked N-acetylglucosamine transferase (SPINDLY family)
MGLDFPGNIEFPLTRKSTSDGLATCALPGRQASGKPKAQCSCKPLYPAVEPSMSNPANQQKLQRAFSLHQAGKLEQAAGLYRQILSEDAGNSYAVHYLGLIEAARGNYEQAKALLNRSLALEPRNTQFVENCATILFQIGDHQSALEVADRGLGLSRTNIALRYINAIALFKLKRLPESLAQFDRLLSFAPNHIAAINERGSVLAEMKKYDAALASFEKALALQPQYAEAYINLANVYGACQSYDNALVAYDNALELKPALADGWLGRGNVLAKLERYEDASRAYDKALSLKHDLVAAWIGRGNVAWDLRHYNEALAAYDKAIALEPESAEAWLGRGNAVYALWRYDEALASYDKALGLKRDLTTAWIGRGNVFRSIRRANDALAAYDRALALETDSAASWAGRGQTLFDMNCVTEALAAYDKALLIKPKSADVISSRIFVLEMTPEAGFQEQQESRKYWWQQVGSVSAQQSPMPHLNIRDPDRRLKVGYLSADFRKHSAAFSFKPMLLNHDKARFEITCYSCSPVEDEVTEDFRQAADRWRQAGQMSDGELSEQIRTDQIDILVDLSGHTAGHRLEVFARKSAPVQVSLGATGTGLPTIDYLFSDPVICPPEVRHLFAEKIFDLPCIMTIEPSSGKLQPSDPPVLTKGYVTFGVFNRVSKISDDAVALWARVLHAVPCSRILIKHYGLDDASLRAAQLKRFSLHGIGEERITFQGATSREDHLTAFKEVDISLDPFPQNGGISTLESLQMGVPVVGIMGNSISSRTAAAILTAIGMSDWVAEQPDEYIAIAKKFASMSDHLTALRRKLPATVASSTIGNSAMYTKAIETAYRTMWVDFCQTTER